MGRTWEALYTKHSQGQKVKGQGHKVMRRSSTKTANISSKRHSVVEMHLSYRKSRSPERGQIFDRKFINSRVCACAVKICSNSLIVLSNRHNFSPIIRNRGRWTRWWGQFLDWKQDWRSFCACALKKSPKRSENVFRQKSYSILQKIGVVEANGEIRFSTGSS